MSPRGKLRPLLRVEALADWLNVSPQRVYQLVRDGILPCVRIGKSVRFDPRVIEEWVDQGGAALEGDELEPDDDEAPE